MNAIANNINPEYTRLLLKQGTDYRGSYYFILADWDTELKKKGFRKRQRDWLIDNIKIKEKFFVPQILDAASGMGIFDLAAMREFTIRLKELSFNDVVDIYW